MSPLSSCFIHTGLYQLIIITFLFLLSNLFIPFLSFFRFPSFVYHGVALKPFHLAWPSIPSVPAQVTREHLSLFSITPKRETLNGTTNPIYLKDFFEKVTFRDDLKMLEISGLPAGEYVLWKKHPYFAPIIIRIGTPLDPTPSGQNSEKYAINILIFNMDFNIETFF